jgi:putative DNA primase/helicase
MKDMNQMPAPLHDTARPADTDRTESPADLEVGAGTKRFARAAGKKQTDIGNGERLAVWGQDKLRYLHGVGWLLWDGKRWVRDEGGVLVEGLAKKAVRGIYGEASYLLEQAADATDESERAKYNGIAKTVQKHAKSSEQASRVTAMIRMARSEQEITLQCADELDAHPHLLNVQNGVLDLESLDLREHDPALLLTKITNAAYVPHAEAPFWTEFVEMILPDEDVRRYVQKAAGYSMLGSYSEYLFIPWGSGQNGKSAFLRATRDVLGDYAGEAAPELLAQKREWGPEGNAALADIRGSRLVTTIETEQGKKMAEVLVKKLTGEATIKAKFMRQDFFEYENQAAVWLATNHKPIVQGTDTAIWRRLRLIPFDVMIPESKRLEPTEVHRRLMAERDGILQWKIEGLRMYRDEKLTEPKAVRAATDAYRQEMDPMSEWLEDCCTFEPEAWETVSVLRESYEAHCKAMARTTIGGRKFNEVLEEHGCSRKAHHFPLSGKKAKAWNGIRVGL